MGKYVDIESQVIDESDDGFLQHIERKVTVKLKRCPCCGGSGNLVTVDDATDEMTEEDMMCVECSKCGIHTEAAEGYEAAVKLWNSRKVGLARKGRSELPCPFCGGKGEAEFALSDDESIPDEESALVMCTKCGARTRVYVNAHEARKVWNRRV